ncbi:transporter substrate-binding domain-containing protein [Martelella mangrovi]|uniref:Branched-chain amino acid transport system substrate-binding protein n=1 Tax=Martelella mangrovi TaxID=1397477 RepID=A0ABV2IIN4_9HYPH
MSAKGLKIGVLFSRSGPMAVTENAHTKGILLACEEINAAGGVLGRMLDPILLDPAGSDEHYASLATELLVKHRVNVIFGACLSTSRKAVLPVIERFNGILFYPSVYEGFEYSPNVVYGGAVPNQVVLPLLEYLFEHEGRRIVLIGSDTLYAREVNRIVTEFLAESGGETVLETYLPIGASADHFGVVLSRLDPSQADAIISTVVGEDSVTLYNAFAAQGLEGGQLPIASLTATESELAAMQPAARAGHISVTSYFSTLNVPANDAFRRGFLERFGADEEPGVYSEVCYSQVHMFADAVRQAGSDETDALLSALSGAVLKGPAGDLFLDTETNHASLRPLIGRATRAGTFDIVWRGASVIRPDPYLVGYDRSIVEHAGA